MNKILVVLALCLFLLSGCHAAMSLATTGAGTSAKIEDNGFFVRTDDLKAGDGSDMPDFYYISPNANLGKYKKVLVADFSSKAKNMSNIRGLQITDYKNLRTDIPDNVSQSLNDNYFSECSRTNKKIDYKNFSAIKRLRADAIIFGNISEMKAGPKSIENRTALVATQVEIKLVDIKTGQEVIKMINRSSTDDDKVSSPIVRRISRILDIARQQQASK